MGTRTAPEPIRAAVSVACRAPSVHNSQPWSWVFSCGSLELHADRLRALPVVDPLARQMVISCGTALHHLEVAVAEHGLGVVVDRLPDPGNPMLLASVAFVSAADSERTRSLREAIAGRWTDRRAFGVPPADALAGFEDLLGRHGVAITFLGEDGPSRLAEATRSGADARRHDAAYHAELYWWTGHSHAEEGIPASALPDGGAVPVGRDFPRGALEPPGVSDQAALAVLTTDSDTRLDWLRCGEALSELLLEATARGLGSCPLTHVTEIAASREMVREAAVASGARGRFPQVVVRLGTPSADEYEVPRTGRRRVDDVWRDAGI
ncbi:Acg family FMN-binding oxidoreductase [Nocardiaceae bacterium NPDC056970]